MSRLYRCLDPRDDAQGGDPGPAGIGRLGLVTRHVGAVEVPAQRYGVDFLSTNLVDCLVLRQAEDVADFVSLAPLHRLPAAVVAVAANGDRGLRPVQADAVDQAAQVASSMSSVMAQGGRGWLLHYVPISVRKSGASIVTCDQAQRDIVGCDAWASPVSGNRPQASLKAGSCRN